MGHIKPPAMINTGNEWRWMDDEEETNKIDMRNLTELQLALLARFLKYVKAQGSYEKSDIVEGYVIDFLEEEYRMNMRFINNTLKEEE